MSALSETTLIEALDANLVAPVKTISAVLLGAGHQAWVVGGSVRDLARRIMDPNLKCKEHDWDMATSAEPREVVKLFRQVIPTGIAHGTVTVVIDRQHFEVTTLRGERGHSDGRRPDEIFFVDDIRADLARRDFTVNAIAYNPEARTLHDPFDGLADLAACKLRAVGDPAARFAEDGLRVLRCARFSATLDFDIDEATKAAIEPSLASFRKVAQERVLVEWLKALDSRRPSRFFDVIFKHGMLAVTAPELFVAETTNFSREETALRLDQLAPDPLLRLALIVVAGTAQKPDAQSANQAAAQNAKLLGKRLKMSRQQLDLILRLSAHHQLPDELLDAPSAPALRRYAAHIGRSELPTMLKFQRACRRPSRDNASPQGSDLLEQLEAQLLKEARSDVALNLTELKVGGQDLIKLGVPKGPQLGQILKRLLERVLDDPSLNTEAQLLALAQLELVSIEQ